MKTIEERAELAMKKEYPYTPSHGIYGTGDYQTAEDYPKEEKEAYENGYIQGATEQKAIDEANPSDELIMRILNAIGYEEESWISFVREHLKAIEK